MSIREYLLVILSNYLESKRNRELHRKVRSVFKELREKAKKLPSVKENQNLTTRFGTGLTNIANVPWLAFLDKRITTTTQKGFYCVYLLKADMSGVYLTLNQGVGKTAKSSPTKEKLVLLHNKAVSLREEFSWLSLQGFSLDECRLNDKGKTGRAYEIATIAYKYYDLEQIPPDTVLEKDLASLLDAYEQYVNAWILSGKPNKVLPIVSEETFSRERQHQEEKARRLSEEELEKKLTIARDIPSVQKTVSIRFGRNPYVAELTKKRAKGKCKLCKKDAPFNDLDGNPFLEIHHIKWLSNGGKDTIKNTVALCPNCHRKVHLLNLEEDRNKLLE